MKIEKEITKTVTETVGYSCDNCAAVMSDYCFIHFESGHHEWGNDSIDSREEWEVCSLKCFGEFTKELFEDNSDYKSFYLNAWFTKSNIDLICNIETRVK